MLLLLAALTVLSIAVYGQMADHGFISFDDGSYITANPVVQQGMTLDGLVWAFSSPHVYNWHPLTWLSHMTDVSMFGLHPGGHHLMSLLFHIANTLLLFVVLKGMTGALWRSAAVAALFALHPLHVESVAWAAERKDVLSALFFMLTLWFYLRYARRPSFGRYWPVVLCYLTGLLAKQMAVTLPFVLLLLDYWPLGRLSAGKPVLPAHDGSGAPLPGKKGIPEQARPASHPAGSGPGTDPVPTAVAWPNLAGLIREKVPLFVLAAVASVAIYLVQSQTGIVKSAEEFPFWARLGNAFVSYVSYLSKTVWPLNLAIFYPHPGAALPLWKGAGAALLVAAATAVVLWARRPYLTVGWLWYLGTLVPVIGIVQVGIQGMADRYTYLPLIGIFIILAWGAAEFAARWRIPGAVLASLAGVAIAALTVLAYFQAATWQSNVTLYGNAVRATQENYWAEYNLGLALGRDEGRDDEALAHFREAVRLKPGYADAWLNIGAILAKRGRLDEAAAHFSRALALDPGLAGANRNLTQLLLQQGKLDEAARRLGELKRIQPEDPETWFLTGRLESRREKLADAEAAFAKALRLRPDYPEALNGLGIVLARQGRVDEAVPRFREALRIRPDYPEARRNLETALGESRKNR